MATKIRPFNLHTDTETRIQTLAGNLIDSAYVNARVSTVDSAAVQVIVDSDYIKTTLKVGSTNTIFRYVATANQTSFTGSDANSATLAYNPGAVQVFLNGSLLTPTVDFTTDSGDTITLVSGAALGSELVINTYKDGIITPTNALPIIGGELTGNLTMGDNKKIKLGNDSDAEIFHNASNTIINDKGTGNILLQVAGTTHFKTDANGVQIPDNKKLLLGASSDLQIYHDGSNSFVDDAGSGSLYLRGESQVIIGNMSGEQAAVFNDDGAVTLNYDNSQKLATTSAGVTITGDVTLNDGSPNFRLNDTDTNRFIDILYGTRVATFRNTMASGEDMDTVEPSMVFSFKDDGETRTAITIDHDANTTFSGDIRKSTAGTSNFAAGVNAGNSITSGGNYNVVVGDEAGTALTTGDKNVAIGFEALSTEDGHGFNVAVGHQALKTLNAGQEAYHTAVGYLAGTSMNTAFANTVIGALAGDALTDGNNNTAVGVLALSADTRGSKSVALGYGALEYQNFTSATDVYNTAVGFSAGNDITTGIYNTLIGGLTGDAITTGGYNVAVGSLALSTETAGQKSVAVGYGALSTQNLTSATDIYNIGVGHQAGTNLTTGGTNTLIGGLSGLAITLGNANVAFGFMALNADTKGSRSTAIGTGSLQTQNFTSATETYNTAVGYNSGNAITTGTYNTLIGGKTGDTMNTGGSNSAVGYQALDGCTDGGGNAALGYRAGYSITSGSRNVGLGEQALRGVTTGNDNIGLGHQSFFATCTGSGNIGMGYRSLFSLTSGSSNVALGYQAGNDITTQSASTYVGYRAGLNHTQGDNVAIGYQVDTNNCGNIITIGYECATVGNLHITMGNGSGANRIYNSFTANANWTRVSDQRWKKDVETNTDCGLSFVNDLRTVTFKKKAPNEVDKSMASYDANDDGINENGLRTVPTHKMYGFLAQEVKEAMDKHNITDFGGWDEAEDSDKTQGISESMFVIPLVKAVQELSAQVTTLTNRITELEK